MWCWYFTWFLKDTKGSAFSFLEFYVFAGKDFQQALHMWKQSVNLPVGVVHFGNWSGVVTKRSTDHSICPLFPVEFDKDAVRATRVRSFSAGICSNNLLFSHVKCRNSFFFFWFCEVFKRSLGEGRIPMITGIRQQLGTDGLLPAEAWPSGAGDQDTLRGSCVLLQIRPMKVVLLLLYRFSICLCACDCMLLHNYEK